MIEIVFHQLRLGLRIVALEKRVVVVQGPGTVVQLPDIIRIDDHLPRAIQAPHLAPIDIGNQESDLSHHRIGKKMSKKNAKEEFQEMAARFNHHKIGSIDSDYIR